MKGIWMTHLFSCMEQNIVYKNIKHFCAQYQIFYQRKNYLKLFITHHALSEQQLSLKITRRY